MGGVSRLFSSSNFFEAQSLQAYIARENERAIADTAVDEYHDDLQDFFDLANYYLSSHECALDYIRGFHEIAADGVTPGTLRFSPPANPLVWVTPWDYRTRLAVERHYGREVAQEHARFVIFSDRLVTRRDESMLDWGIVSTVRSPDFRDDPRLRTEVKLAVARLYASRVDLLSLSRVVAGELEGRGLRAESERVKQSVASIPGCQANPETPTD